MKAPRPILLAVSIAIFAGCDKPAAVPPAPPSTSSSSAPRAPETPKPAPNELPAINATPRPAAPLASAPAADPAAAAPGSVNPPASPKGAPAPPPDEATVRLWDAARTKAVDEAKPLRASVPEADKKTVDKYLDMYASGGNKPLDLEAYWALPPEDRPIVNKYVPEILPDTIVVNYGKL